MLQELLNQIPTWTEFIAWIKNSMATNQFFATAGFFGAIGVLATKGKDIAISIWKRIYRLIYYKATVEESSMLFEYIDMFLFEKYSKEFRNVLIDTEYKSTNNTKTTNEPLLEPSNNVDKPSKKNKESICYKQLDDTIFLWRGINLIKIYNGRERLENANSSHNMFLRRYTFSGIFAKRIINKLLGQILEYKKNLQELENRRSVKIHTNSGYHWYSEVNIEPKDFDLIISDNKYKLLDSINKFISEEDLYKKRGILYKKGFLLYGPPGTGKTSLILSLARKLNIPIYMFNPANVTDDELISLYKKVPKHSILLVEDSDAVFRKDRTEENNKIKFRFSTLLQCMDGALSTHGLITIFTTNHIERLDEALIRNGRMDEKIFMGPADKKRIVDYINLFYETKVSYDVITRDINIPLCDVQGICQENEGDINNVIKILNHEEN